MRPFGRLGPCAALAVVLLAGCGGAGGAAGPAAGSRGGLPPVGASPTPVAAPTAPAAAPGQGSPQPVASSAPVAGQGIVRFTVRTNGSSSTTSSSSRRPAYISTATQSIKIAYTSLNGSSWGWEEMGFTPGSPGCTTANGVTTCSVQWTMTSGSAQFAITMYDGPLVDTGNYNYQPSGHLLSTVTQNATIVANQVNQLTFTLQGVPAAIALSLAQPTPPAGTAVNGIPVTVSVKDGSGATILGPGAFSSPITLTNPDASGATTLKVNGVAGSTVTAPSDVVTLDYSGRMIAADTLTAASSGVAGASATFAPVAQPIQNVTDLTFNGNYPEFLQPTEAGFTNFGQAFTESDNCGSIATVQTWPNSNWVEVTAANAGTCQITLSDPFGQSAVSHVSVTETTIILQSRAKRPGGR